MVQLMKFGNLRSETAAAAAGYEKSRVKVEIEDPLEEEHGPLNKRSKPSLDLQEVWILLNYGLLGGALKL